MGKASFIGKGLLSAVLAVLCAGSVDLFCIGVFLPQAGPTAQCSRSPASESPYSSASPASAAPPASAPGWSRSFWRRRRSGACDPDFRRAWRRTYQPLLASPEASSRPAELTIQLLSAQ